LGQNLHMKFSTAPPPKCLGVSWAFQYVLTHTKEVEVKTFKQRHQYGSIGTLELSVCRLEHFPVNIQQCNDL
jgi:hypothetical protein